MRKIKGVFLENLELNDFPVDVQVKIFTFFFVKTNSMFKGFNYYSINYTNS